MEAIAKAKRKSKKQRISEEIIEFLQTQCYVTDRELESGSLIYRDAYVLPEEVAPIISAHYGVVKEKKEFGNWHEFIDSAVDAVLAAR